MKKLNYHTTKTLPVIGPGRKPFFVYVIRCEGFVKIGVAGNPKARLRELQVGCPFQLHLVRSFMSRNPHKDERTLHTLLSKHHHRGEWFSLSEPLERLLESFQIT